ncbi:MAG: hypothetical protein SGJ27_17115 [Candidatus Melainabacteria bacterium]|nr:hypothetical protein [Candidatus Melainabacteria bacterium]
MNHKADKRAKAPKAAKVSVDKSESSRTKDLLLSVADGEDSEPEPRSGLNLDLKRAYY